MKIEQKHIKHKTWLTKVTMGEGESAKSFGLRKLSDGKFRIYSPFGASKPAPFWVGDFDSKEDAFIFIADPNVDDMIRKDGPGTHLHTAIVIPSVDEIVVAAVQMEQAPALPEPEIVPTVSVPTNQSEQSPLAVAAEIVKAIL